PRGAGGHARLRGAHAARPLARGHAARARPRHHAEARGSRGRLRDPRAPDPARPPHLHGAQPGLPQLPAQADVPVRAEAPGRAPQGCMSERNLQRVSELALIGIASIWGLTFVMVKDAIEELPTMAFLAYRFIPASMIVAVVFRRQLASLSRDGWRAGAVMGVFLTGGYVFQTLGLEKTTASNAG